MEVYISLIVAIIATSGVLIGYVYQSHERLKEKRLTAKQEQYEVVLKNVMNLLISKPGKEYGQTLMDIERVWLYASDEVLNKCYCILSIHKEISVSGKPAEVLRNDKDAKDRFDTALRELFVAVRKDLGFERKTNIEDWPIDEVELFPLGIIRHE